MRNNKGLRDTNLVERPTYWAHSTQVITHRLLFHRRRYVARKLSIFPEVSWGGKSTLEEMLEECIQEMKLEDPGLSYPKDSL